MAFDLESVSEATSGAVGALVSTTILYPLDTCKTKYQAEVSAHHQQKYRFVKLICLWFFLYHFCLNDFVSLELQSDNFAELSLLYRENISLIAKNILHPRKKQIWILDLFDFWSQIVCSNICQLSSGELACLGKETCICDYIIILSDFLFMF